jgi:hypothetical protein
LRSLLRMQREAEEQVDEILARRLAGETLIDVRTVRKFLRGEPVRRLVSARIEAAMATRDSEASR